jgi:hypothetical protein
MKLKVLSICEETGKLCQTHIRRLNLCREFTSLLHNFSIQCAFRTIELASLQCNRLKTKKHNMIGPELRGKVIVSEPLCVCMCTGDSRTLCEC